MNNSVFKIKEDGVFLDEKKVCDYLKIVGFVKTFNDNVWKTRIEFKDLDGEICTIDVENEKLSNVNDWKKELIRKGLSPDINANVFREYIIHFFRGRNSIKRYTEVNETGWINEDTYICPSFLNAESSFIMSRMDDVGYSISGTIDQWRDQIADLCQNNSVLTFALCAALAPVLLRYFPEINTTIFHLVGQSSIGKTTALKVAASIWGNPKKYIKQWRATGNAQEGVAEKHNDSLLILDEIGQANDKDIQQTVYILGNEKGKSRMTADAILKKTKSWRLLCLSSGEIGISEKIESAGERVHGGVLVRCVDIEALSSKGLGIFEDLRGFSNGNEFSTAITERTSKYYGTAAKFFVDGLKDLDEDTVRNVFAESLQRIKKHLNLENSKEGAMLRVLNAFALVNTAGILACNDCIGVLPHNCIAIDEDIYNIIRRCLPNIYSQENETEEIVEDVLQFLQQNESRFRHFDRNDLSQGLIYHDEDNRNIKWLGGFETKGAQRVYYIFPNAFKDEICKEKSMKLYKKVLKEKGIMLTYSDGKDIRYTINGERIRMITLCFG